MTASTSAPAITELLREHVAELQPHASKDGIESVWVPRSHWRVAADWLSRHGFERFIDLTCVDNPAAPERFELHLLCYAMQTHSWVRLVTHTDDQVDSVVPVYEAANNYEREVFDLFGVQFVGHPQLTRILLPDNWVGHPLQRDVPMVVEPVDFTVTRELYKT
jgi:NADH-quinone oxidoreductase subunit C